MEVLSKLEALPLGAREIFTGELRSLYDSRERLRTATGRVPDESLEKNRHRRSRAHTIIEKAPQLLSFTAH